jgi:hypothetical protein
MTRICMFEGFDSIRQEKEKVIQKKRSAEVKEQKLK